MAIFSANKFVAERPTPSKKHPTNVVIMWLFFQRKLTEEGLNSIVLIFKQILNYFTIFTYLWVWSHLLIISYQYLSKLEHLLFTGWKVRQASVTKKSPFLSQFMTWKSLAYVSKLLNHLHIRFTVDNQKCIESRPLRLLFYLLLVTCNLFVFNLD